MIFIRVNNPKNLSNCENNLKKGQYVVVLHIAIYWYIFYMKDNYVWDYKKTNFYMQSSDGKVV